MYLALQDGYGLSTRVFTPPYHGLLVELPDVVRFFLRVAEHSSVDAVTTILCADLLPTVDQNN